MKVYQAISAVQGALAKKGVGKNNTNTFDNYKFRGIDDVYNALSPLLAEHGLCILPRILSRTVEERTSQKGGALFYVTVEAEFDFVCSEDFSKHTIKVYGEAMDRGDKATNKAMAAAYKYAAFLAFAIPTEGENDADSQTHEVQSRPKGTITPTTGSLEALPAATQKQVMDTAILVKDALADDRPMDAYSYCESIGDVDSKVALWSLLDSKARSTLKRMKDAEDGTPAPKLRKQHIPLAEQA
jgi:hypothetical protein